MNRACTAREPILTPAAMAADLPFPSPDARESAGILPLHIVANSAIRGIGPQRSPLALFFKVL